MARATLFRSNRSQAVRLPKAVAFPEEVREVEILKIGESRILTPIGRRWDDFFGKGGSRVSDDFMSERDDPPPPERESL